jgi:hypothetical protein
VAAVGKLVNKRVKRQLYTKGEAINKTIQNHRTHKTQNKNRKQTKRILKNLSRVIRK